MEGICWFFLICVVEILFFNFIILLFLFLIFERNKNVFFDFSYMSLNKILNKQQIFIFILFINTKHYLVKVASLLIPLKLVC